MKSALVLRTVLGRWWQLAGFLPFVIYVVALGGPAVANGISVWLMGIVGWIAGVFGEGSPPPYWPKEVGNRVGYVPQRFSGFGWMKVDACLALVGTHYDHWDYDMTDRLR
ncbi:MAG: hypothetical protein OXH09_20385, partial [Gammaproteobacteria bacterium]|nr:hypothetical protein [Gammaproteobacteria bacterium]